MRMAVIGIEGVNTYYRAFYPAREMQRRGHAVRYDSWDDAVKNLEPYTLFDAVLIHRTCDGPVQRFARHLQRQGVAVLWDNDDQLWGLAKDSPDYRRIGGFRSEAILANTRKMVQLADVVTTPSAVLAETYRSFGARAVHIVGNYVPDEHLRRRSDRNGAVVIGWTAAREHKFDFDRLRIREVLQHALAADARVAVRSIGINLGLESDRYEHIDEVPFPRLTDALATFDVGIAPLADVPTNRTRSNAKLKEYAAVGVPWLASPIGPYAGMGQGEGGSLVGDDAWAETLTRLVADDRGRRKLAKRAEKWGRSQTMSRNGAVWEAAFEAAVAARRQRAAS